MQIPMKPAGIISVPNYKDCSIEVKPNGELMLIFKRPSQVEASNFTRFVAEEEVVFVRPAKCRCDHPVLYCTIHEKEICPKHYGKQKCFCSEYNHPNCKISYT
jgi:hypothetical protein